MSILKGLDETQMKDIDDVVGFSSPESLEHMYREATRVEMMKDPNYLDFLHQEESILRNGIQGQFEGLERLRQHAIDTGDAEAWRIVIKTLKNIGGELKEDAIKAFLPDRWKNAITAIKGLGLKNDNDEETIKEIIKDVVPFGGAAAELYETPKEELEEYKTKLEGTVDSYIDNIKNLENQKRKVESEINKQHFDDETLRYTREAILKKHPEFKTLDSEIEKEINADESSLAKRFRDYKSRSGKSKSASANVFTRINELLAQINASLQQLDANLQIS